MSAFVGIFHLDKRLAEVSDLHRMLAPVRHRGPDGSGTWTEGSVGLGHCLLQITPESVYERLPQRHESGAWVVAADTRIDNRPELIDALRLDPHVPISDSELLLHAYNMWGDRCPERFLGDFAFAIWDANRQRLFCARDQYGLRPFYYYHAPHIFAFASDIRAILALPQIPKRLNEAKIADLLVPTLEDRVETCYVDVVRLPAAHTLTVTQERVATRQYWQLDYSREHPAKSTQDYIDGFRDVFSKAVQCRMRSLRPVGSMLSGGLDTSSIVCTTRRTLHEARELESSSPSYRTPLTPGLHTFSAVFHGQSFSEHPYIDAVVRQGGSIAHLMSGEGLQPLGDVEFALDQVGEMFFGPNLFMHIALFRLIREQGIRLLFDGFDGDSAVSHGVAHLTALARSGRFISAMREAKALAQNFQFPLKHFALNRIVYPTIPTPVRNLVRKIRRNPWQWDAVIHPDFVRRVHLAERIRTFRKPFAAPIDSAKQEHGRGLMSGAYSYVYEVTDRVASAFGIQMVFPFADIRLLEYCVALPPEQKLHNGWTRLIMRRSMSELPSKVRWRTGKSDYTDMLVGTMVARHRDLIDQVLLRDSAVLEPYVDLPRLRNRYKRLREQPSSMDALTIWKTTMLGLWLKRAAMAA